ncbi:MAG: type II toxin-antitoxin system Phd/YefM family antitoxin [Thermoanaerobaculia bacterium]
MTTLTVTQAKNSLLELLRDVEERGETVQITRNGIPAGVLVSAEEWESLLETVSILSDAAAMKKIVRARREIAAGVLLTHEQVWRRDGVPAAVPSRRGKGHSSSSGRRGQASPSRPRAARRKSPAR